MCGIIGAVGDLPSKKRFIHIRDTLSHRGPDDADLYYDTKTGVALGHRRLSIIDLSVAGKQPMWSPDKRYAVVFNGEIFNYRELKDELKHSYTFVTNTDTEVLLASYIVWKERALQKLNGEFAFAIWDTETKILFCARDRLGVKPFFYTTHNSTFYFSSEIKGFLAFPGITPKVNDAIVYDYLAHGYYDHTEQTFFKGIKSLPSGHTLTYHKGKLTMKSYWDLAMVRQETFSIPKKDAEKRFLELFEDSIRLRLRSDVPVGVNLSSGIDSAAILFFAEKSFGKQLHTFSMCSKDSDFNECAFIKPTLSKEQLALWHTHTLSPENVSQLMSEVLAVQDEPYGGIPTMAYYKLAQLTKEAGVTVILEGQGGDEIFGGYRYYRPEFLKHNVGGMSQDTTTEVNTFVLRDGFRNGAGTSIEFQKPFASPLLNAQYRDLKYTKLPRVLRFNDRLSMAFGREYREPYLDHRLVEFCFFLPDELKIQGTEQKVLLRNAMKHTVPNLTTKRPKKTFGALQTPWFRKYLQKEIIGILSSESFGRRPYWDQIKVLEMANKFFNGEGDNSFYIWQWVNLELWLRAYID